MAENLREYARKRTLDELISDRQSEEQKRIGLYLEVEAAKNRLSLCDAHAKVFQEEINWRLGIVGLGQ